MIWTILFLGVVGVLLPLAAWSGYRQLKGAELAAEEMPSALSMAAQALVVFAVVFGLAWAAAASRGLGLEWVGELTPASLGAGAVALAAWLAWASWEARRPLGPASEVRKHLRRQGVTAPGVVMMIGAAVTEEFAYRGVLFLLLGTVVPPIVAALASAVLFGLGHANQGLRGTFGSFGFGLSMQLLCALSGGLLLAIVVHFLYDLSAAWLGSRLVSSESKETP